MFYAGKKKNKNGSHACVSNLGAAWRAEGANTEMA